MAILAADVANYSWPIGDDEKATLAALSGLPEEPMSSDVLRIMR